MKELNIIAVLIILAQINRLEALECKLEAPAKGLLQFSDPQKDIAEHYCQQFGLSRDTNNPYEITADQCIEGIMPYMKEVKETKESITNVSNFYLTSKLK